jgi:hypothetical protein
MRVSDPIYGLDRVYNYGTFDFQTRHFYWRFMRGDLLYFLSSASFGDFYNAYQQDNRALLEQVLALKPDEIQEVYEGLETTLHSQAKYYRYQFFADNCTTRLFDLVSTSLEAPIQLDSTYTNPASYRQLLAPYLTPSPWVKLGMNLGLGLPADQQTTFRQRLFLPVELQMAFAHASREEMPFVAQQHYLFVPVTPSFVNESPSITPTSVFLSLGVMVLVIGLLKQHQSLIGRGLRVLIFASTGLIGCLLLGLSLFSLHSPTHSNYQLLWLLPTHIGFAFAYGKRKWRGYTIFSFMLLILSGLIGGILYYIQLLPEVYMVLALVAAQLVILLRQPSSSSTLIQPE